MTFLITLCTINVKILNTHVDQGFDIGDGYTGS